MALIFRTMPAVFWLSMVSQRRPTTLSFERPSCLVAVMYWHTGSCSALNRAWAAAYGAQKTIALYFYMAQVLSSVLAKPRMRERLSPATRAQLALSMSLASEIGPNDLTEVIEQCLNRDDGWLEVSRECLVQVKYSEGSTEAVLVVDPSGICCSNHRTI